MNKKINRRSTYKAIRQGIEDRENDEENSEKEFGTSKLDSSTSLTSEPPDMEWFRANFPQFTTNKVEEESEESDEADEKDAVEEEADSEEAHAAESDSPVSYGECTVCGEECDESYVDGVSDGVQFCGMNCYNEH